MRDCCGIDSYRFCLMLCLSSKNQKNPIYSGAIFVLVLAALLVKKLFSHRPLNLIDHKAQTSSIPFSLVVKSRFAPKF